MKFLKWFVFVGFYLFCFLATVTIYDSPPIVFVLGGLAYFVAWFIYFGLPESQKDRQPMATAKSGGREPQRNWNHRPEGIKRPEPPPGPPSRVDRVGVFIAQPIPEERNGVGFLDLPRAWPEAEDAAGAGLACARQGAIQEKQDLDRRAKSLSNFIGLSEAFERLDPVEQDLLRHQCEHMWSYSEVLGARIANWRDKGPVF